MIQYPGEQQLDFWQKRLASRFVYVIGTDEGLPVKIGKAKNPRSRMATFQTANWQPLELMYVVPGYDELEIELHQIAYGDCLNGEWFKPGPDRDKAVAAVKRLATDTVAAYGRTRNGLPPRLPFIVSADERPKPRPQRREVWATISRLWLEDRHSQKYIRLAADLEEHEYEHELLRMFCEGNYRLAPRPAAKIRRVSPKKKRRAVPKNSRQWKRDRRAA